MFQVRNGSLGIDATDGLPAKLIMNRLLQELKVDFHLDDRADCRGAGVFEKFR